MARIAIQTFKESDGSSSSSSSHSSSSSVDVHLSQELWDVLLGQLEPVMEGNHTGGSSSSSSSSNSVGSQVKANGKQKAPRPPRIPISISRTYKTGGGSRRGGINQSGTSSSSSSAAPIQSLICWACLDSLPVENINKSKEKGSSHSTSSSSASSSSNGRIRAPAKLRKRYPSLLGLPHCALNIELARPIQLSTVFLLASNKASYRYAQENQVELESLLAKDGRILRQNEVMDLLSEGSEGRKDNKLVNGYHETLSNPLSMKIAFTATMTEPVLQGYVSEEDTEIIVLPPLESSSSEMSSKAPQQPRQMQESQLKDKHKHNGAWHVDETFLSGELDDDNEDNNSEDERHRHLLNDHVMTAGQASSTWQSPLSSPGTRSAQLEGSGSVSGRLNPDGIIAPGVSSEAGSRFQNNNNNNNKGRLIRALACREYIDEQDLSPFPNPDEDEHMRVFVRASDLAKLGLFSGDMVEIQGLSSPSGRLVRLYGLRDAPTLPDSDLWLLLSPILLHNMGSPPIVRLQPHKQQNNLRQSSPTGLASNSLANAFPVAKAISIARIASEHSMQKRYQPLFISALKMYFKVCKRVLQQGDLIALPIDAGMSQFIHKETESSGTPEQQEEEDEFELPFSESRPTAVAYFSVATLEAPQSGKGDPVSAPFGCYVDPAATTMIQTGLINSPIPDAHSYLGIDNASQMPHEKLETVDPVMARCLDLVKASTLKHSGDLKLNLTILVKGARGSGKATLVRQIAQLSGFHLLELDCYELLGDTDTKTEGNLAARFDRAASCTPCILLLRHIEALARKSQALETGQEPTIASTLQECLKVAQEARANTGYPLILVGTTSDVDKIPLSVIGLFKEEVAIEAPAEAERLRKLQSMLSGDILSPDVSVKSLAVQTAALVATDLADLCDRARKGAVARLLEAGLSIDECQNAGIPLTAADFASALDHARTSYSESIGAPKIPNVSWDDVGGLAKVKTEILDTIQLPLEHPELFEEGLKKRSGVLLYGPPGTGKTLLAKAVATSCSLNFFSVKGPELLNMYIGESEANVRRVFQRARDAKPCVIFFDELDSVAPKRGNQGDSGGVMDRIVSQLLAELDGMSEGKGGADVFVIGATNRPDLLDPALLRPGRFDRMLYLGVSDNHDSQLKIIEALTRKFKLDPGCDLARVAEQCPFNYTGADFYALCSDALLKAMSRKAEAVDARIAELNRTDEYKRNPLTPQYYLAELASPHEMQVTVSQVDFEQALRELVPSVSEAEMLHYKVVQQRFNPDKQTDPEPKPMDRKGKGKARE